MKQYFLLVFSICFTCNIVIAQNYDFSNLLNVKLLDAGPITNQNEIQGYYLFFEKDRKAKDSSEFMVKILDYNLNELTNREFKSAPSTNIEALVFNGKSIVIKTFIQEKKDLHFSLLNMQVNGTLDSIGGETIKIHQHSTSSIHSVPNKGFANIYTTHNHKAILEFYGNNGEKWTYNTPEEVSWEELSYVVDYDNQLLISSYRKNKVSGQSEYFLKSFDMATGNEIYDQVMTDYGYDHKISRGFINTMQDEIWITGPYFNKGDKKDLGYSQGLFIMKVNPDGEIDDTDYIPWDGKIDRYSKTYTKGKLKEGSFFVHDFVYLNTEEIFAITEQYSKQFRPVGVAEAALSLGLTGKLASIQIGDIMVFRFSNDAKLLDKKRSRKPSRKEFSNTGIYGGTFIPKAKMGEIMNEQGEFDFSHISVDNDFSSFTVFYYMKEQLSKRQIKKNKRHPRYILQTLTFKNREWTKDKFYLTDGSGETLIDILPAKPGYVVIGEFNEEYRGLRLEKIQ